MEVSYAEQVIIQNTNSVMRILDNGVLHIKYPKGRVLEVEDIKEIQEGFENLPEPKPTKVLQELSPFGSMSAEARKYAADRSPKLDGIAYVIHSLAQRLIIRFYISM